MLQNGILYRFGQDNRFRGVLQHEQMPTILQELHNEVGGGHFSSNITTMNSDVHEFCRTCDLCQRISNLLTKNMAKLIILLHE